MLTAGPLSCHKCSLSKITSCSRLEPGRLFASVSVSKEHGNVFRRNERTNTLGNLCKPSIVLCSLAHTWEVLVSKREQIIIK